MLSRAQACVLVLGVLVFVHASVSSENVPSQNAGFTPSGVWLVDAPRQLFKDLWVGMCRNYTLFEIAVYISELVHLAEVLFFAAVMAVVQCIPALRRYKVQQDRADPSLYDWAWSIGWLLCDHLFIQFPLIVGNYYFVVLTGLPYTYETIPGVWSFVWRLYAAMVIEDTWQYWGHRALHVYPSLYKRIHKVHHSYPAPFGVVAEYAHPIETMFLGIGFFWPLLLSHHFLFIWLWLFLRVGTTTDAHSGYEFPWNPLYLVPGIAVASHHDFHHKNFMGNYGTTFIWWDKMCGTDEAFERHERNKRAEHAAECTQAMENHGRQLYSSLSAVQPLPQSEWRMRACCLVTGANGMSAVQPLPQSEWRLRARCLVTGANGMVGARLVQMLVERGATRIVCLDVLPQPKEFAAQAVAAARAGCQMEYRQCDISDQTAMLGAAGAPSPFSGVDVVFHIAALVGPFFKHELFTKVNVVGSENVVAACRACGVRALVDCSSPSTHFDGYDIEGKAESELAYASVHEYARTKGIAERFILGANGSTATANTGTAVQLATTAIAPHQVYGPTDQLFLPALLEAAASGRLRIFGKGDNLVSFTHVDNIAHALFLAGVQLHAQGPRAAVAGEFVVVTDGPALPFWDVVDSAVVQCGLPSLTAKARLPTPLLWVAAHAGRGVSALTGRFVKLMPFTLNMLLIHRYFCIEKARRLLRYEPVRRFENPDGWRASVAAVRERMVREGRLR